MRVRRETDRITPTNAEVPVRHHWRCAHLNEPRPDIVWRSPNRDPYGVRSPWICDDRISWQRNPALVVASPSPRAPTAVASTPKRLT